MKAEGMPDSAELARIEEDIESSCGNKPVEICNFLLMLTASTLSHIAQPGNSSKLFAEYQKHLAQALEARLAFDRSKQV